MRDHLPPWLVAALSAATADADDAALVDGAAAHGAGLVSVAPDGSVTWSDEAYRLHGRPRWRRVRTIDDVTRGLTPSDAGRVTAAYLTLVDRADVEILYSVRGETGLPLDVLLYSARPGLAVVERAPYVDSTPARGTDTSTVTFVAAEPVAEEPEEETEPTLEPVVTLEQSDDQADELAAAALRVSPDVLLVLDVATGGIVEVRGADDAGLDVVRQLAEGAAVHDVVHPDDLDAVLAWRGGLVGLAADDVTTMDARVRLDGEWRWQELRATGLHRASGGALLTVLVVAHDVHERREALAQLVESERAFREVFDASPSGLAVLDDSGHFVTVNEAFTRLVGRTRDDILQTVYEALIHHEDRAAAVLSRARRDGGPAYGGSSEHRLLRSDGSVISVRARTAPVTYHSEPRLLISVENVTAARALEDQLRHDALHDPLTGLPNRRLLLDRLERALSRSRRTGTRLGLFFIDVDDLKRVNDTHPWQHRAGDVMLTTMAVSIRATLRDTDTIGRLGGDEFLAICEDVGDDVAVAELGERLLAASRQPIALGPQTLSPGISVGLAVASDDEETAEQLLDRADAAMYLAKSRGGGQIVRADDIATSAPVADLVGALARGELRMQYAPVVSLASGAVLGVHAVLRWQHPSLGLLPAHDVRSALDSAATLPVVDWCLERVIADVRTVAPDRVEHVSVWLPVPGRAVQATSTLEAVDAAMRGPAGDLAPDTSPSIVLDVHEADLALLTRRPTFRQHLDTLAALGPVALGVEHLSADVLPVGSLQLLGSASASIDPELIRSAAENDSVELLVRSIISAATALGVVTVATGIGSIELLEEARRLGVHAVQGDLIGPAATLEAYADLLHGEPVTLPHAPHPELPTDLPPAARPVLAAIRALEEESAEHDARLDADGLDDDEDEDELPLAVDTSWPPLAAVAAVAAVTMDDEPDELEDDAIEEQEAVLPEPPVDESDADPSLEAATPAIDLTTPSPSPSTIISDVVDLAEQVARELGFALPAADPAPGGSLVTEVEQSTAEESTPLVDSDATAAPGAVGGPRRLPGAADLGSLLASPELQSALSSRRPADETAASDDVPESPAQAPEPDDEQGPTAAAAPDALASPSLPRPTVFLVVNEPVEAPVVEPSTSASASEPVASPSNNAEVDLRDVAGPDLRARSTDFDVATIMARWSSTPPAPEPPRGPSGPGSLH